MPSLVSYPLSRYKSQVSSPSLRNDNPYVVVTLKIQKAYPHLSHSKPEDPNLVSLSWRCDHPKSMIISRIQRTRGHDTKTGKNDQNGMKVPHLKIIFTWPPMVAKQQKIKLQRRQYMPHTKSAVSSRSPSTTPKYKEVRSLRASSIMPISSRTWKSLKLP